jgi:hypothetical protein
MRTNPGKQADAMVTSVAEGDHQSARNAPNDGRSAERARQDDAIEQAANEESWITRLLRSFKLSKGRPNPGNRKTND